MRSGNGRHRRPRQAPAIVVAAGVTGSAIALPLLGAGSATAADGATWDRVAECESGGAWSANLGNGFYGGLQFSQADWESFGGTDYAERADLASRSQQIAVAEKVRAARGDKAWETCAAIAGLNATTDPAGTGTGKPAPGPSASPEDPEGPEDAETPEHTDSPKPSHEPGDTATPDAPGATETSPAPEGDRDNGERPAGETAPGTGRHRGEPAEEAPPATGPGAGTTAPATPTAPPVTGDPDGAAGTTAPGAPAPGAAEGDREPGQHASRGAGAGRTGGDLTDPANTGQYTVRPGDNLSAIAQSHEVAGGWTALYDANKSTVGGDPDLILPGQSLELAAPAPKAATGEAAGENADKGASTAKSAPQQPTAPEK
ncbi:transglycosylase family protein [Streptomyces sp. LP05-1]|uniref:Transglycosylase family protein n=1 Tax=Streptomyces pyxinae TaxID=2970734 RepID=A0ABT2CMQ3_9ACTN|nr:transglycosylase family protein [Streptomyces sp. LP05-1]MCS0637864.1 transglycosylase family protein [Streptomyces sp. LP05-1]